MGDILFHSPDEDEKGVVLGANNWRSQLAFLVKREPC